TGICGASAIAAVSGVVEASEAEIVYAVSTIFVFNLVAVLLFPPVGHLLGLSQSAFGLWAGTAVNDTSSVVAAATGYGAIATHTAVVTKLTRTLAIIPISLGLASWGPGGRHAVRATRLVPGFMLGFLALAALNSAGLLPASSHAGLAQATTLLVTVALSAIGLSIDIRALRRTGPCPIALGAALWLVVSVASLSLQALTA
ncbi:MAG: YeiH family protein, partial [Solirubrobacteraceae bacterium]